MKYTDGRTPLAPSATQPKPRDPDRIISTTLDYLLTEQMCGATHIRIDEVRALLHGYRSAS